jgi:hypothetical protein
MRSVVSKRLGRGGGPLTPLETGDAALLVAFAVAAVAAGSATVRVWERYFA